MITRPQHMTQAEADDYERKLRNEMAGRKFQHVGDNGNGKAEIYKILLWVASSLLAVVATIVGWGASHLITQQDNLADTQRQQGLQLVILETKLNLLLEKKDVK